MGSMHLGTMIFYLAVISSFTAGVDNDAFVFELTPDNMTYSMSLSRATVDKWYAALCSNATSVTHIIGSTLTTLNQSYTDVLTCKNVFSCEHFNQTNFTCTRLANQECDETQRFVEFHSTNSTTCPCKCIGICYRNYAPRSSWQFYFTPVQKNDGRCEGAVESSTTKVELLVLIIVAAALGSVIIVVTTALICVAIATCRRPKFHVPEISRSSSFIPPTETTEKEAPTIVIPPYRTKENQAPTTVVLPTRAANKQAGTTVIPPTRTIEKQAPTKDTFDRQATSHVYANNLEDPGQSETSRISSPYLNV